MKRNIAIERSLHMHHWAPPYFIPKDIVPPHSIVKLKKSERHWDADLNVGDTFRVGYYSRLDGPNVVWLVTSDGRYEQTWDQVSLLDYFELVTRTNETDIYGRNAPPLESIV